MVEAPSPGEIVDDGGAACNTFRMKGWLLFACVSSSSGLFCAAAAAFAGDSTAAKTLADPAAYCSMAGTRDTPRPLPAELNAKAAAALGLAADAALSAGYFWRCMHGAVYVCAVGANIPCQFKADRAKHNAGAEAFCREKHDADSVPAYASGHRTIYEWRCEAGVAMRGKRVAELDRRGYRIDFWRRLVPDGSR
jgi:hypothetical protein